MSRIEHLMLKNDSRLGVISFCTASYSADQCGANGLPLTPNSVKVVGRFQHLKNLSHPNLCSYLDILRKKSGRVFVVSEYYKENLLNKLSKQSFCNIHNICNGVLNALSYLHEKGIVHRNLSSTNICFDYYDNVKLSSYGLYYMTNCGQSVSFPIGKLQYMSPESLLEIYSDKDFSFLSFKSDVWSFGLVVLEIVTQIKLWSSLSVQQVMYKLINFITNDVDPFTCIVNDHNIQNVINEIPSDLLLLVKSCLRVNPKERPSLSDLMNMITFYQATQSNNSMPLHTSFLKIQSSDKLPWPIDDSDCDDNSVSDPLSVLSLPVIYHLWQLAGGDVENTLNKTTLFKKIDAPIVKIGKFVPLKGDVYGDKKDYSVMMDESVVILCLGQLLQRLTKISPEDFYPLIHGSDSIDSYEKDFELYDKTENHPSALLPLVIKEKDIDYQFHRIVLFENLLKGYPANKVLIISESKFDIPPFFRGLVWAVLLEICGDVSAQYDIIDKETPTPTDRQIAVDVPRCHQYNELLSSPDGHSKFRRVLKAWVINNPQYVYWQGLDSLAAPFICLNFNNEAIAFSCLQSFINKYLANFFLKDNSHVIQEYLAKFSHMIAYHAPDLFNHLDEIGFIPDLFAIPWFLTMYAHVFPMHKIFHLWDTLLQYSSSFPLCIGVAILKQLKDQLLDFGFNECILLFSDMPEIDIESCVKDSVELFNFTPLSTAFMKHGSSSHAVSDSTSNNDNSSKFDINFIDLDILKSEKCPRISANDTINLCGCAPTDSSYLKCSFQDTLIIDVRSKEEFSRGCLPNSISIPFLSAFDADGGLILSNIQIIDSRSKQIKIIVGNRGNDAIEFSLALLKLGYSRVCVLHKGIELLKSSGILIVP